MISIYVSMTYEIIIPGGKSMKKLQIKAVRTLNKGRVELTFYGEKGQRIKPKTTKNRGYKEDSWIDAKSLRPL